MQTEKVNGANGVSSKALAKAPSAQISGGTEKDLNRAVDRVKKVMAATRENAWQLGQELKSIFDSELWMARKGEDGKPKYKTFDAFVRDEFHFVKAQAFNYMRVAKQFTQEEVTELGVEKLSVIANLPAAQHKKLKEAARKQTSREVRKEVQKLRASGEVAPDAKRRGRKAQTTVIKVGDKYSVQLLAKPTTAEEKAKPKRAMKLADEPWGKFEHENGVVEYFRVKETAKGLELVVVTKRVEDL